MKFNQRNVFISPKARLGHNVQVGDNTVIYDNVLVGDNSVICNDCVLGEPLPDYYRNPETYENPPLVLGENSLIRSHCLFYAGSVFGPELATGHRALVRHNVRFGRNCMIGINAVVDNDVTAGDYCRVYEYVNVAELTTLGQFVFMFAYSMTTSDPAPPSYNLRGVSIGDYTILGVKSTVLPGVTLGEHCVIGANSVVTRDLAAYSLAIGSPARVRCDVREHGYPWPQRFSRGMPWQGGDYDEWLRD